MTFGDDLNSQVRQILRERWTTRSGRVVPEPEDLGLGNDAVTLDGTVLYADLDESTDLVNENKPSFAAEVYKSFLACAARIVQAEGASVTGYDGDRIMGVFIGDSRNTAAARTALKINYAVLTIINPAIRDQYPSSGYAIRHHVGVDTSQLYVARTGVRGAKRLGLGGPSRKLRSQAFGAIWSEQLRLLRPFTTG